MTVIDLAMRSRRRLVYLVPGFFGFNAIGAVNYFRGVADALAVALDRQGLSARVVECPTQPTGSIRRRAERLIDTVVDTGGLQAEEIHFVGHSTGGLDIRLATTPGVRLRSDRLEDAVVARTRSVVTLATPHYGTPIASFFTTLPGRHALELLALAATSRGGRYTLYSGARILKLIAAFDDRIGRRETFLDVWARRFLSRITHSRNDPVWHFLREVARDQGAIIQLTPESMHLFNAAVIDHGQIDYGCVVTAAPPPPMHFEAEDILRPSRAVFAGAFAFLHTLAAREHRHYPYPHPGNAALRSVEAALPFRVTTRTNDGIVPSLSQIHGTVLDIACADHLDIVGQYATGERHSDWLPSGSRFARVDFDRTWERIARFIASHSEARRHRARR